MTTTARTGYVGTQNVGDVLTSANFTKLPNGIVAYQKVSLAQTGITGSLQAITNLSVTFTAAASRFYLITAQVNLTNPSSTGFIKAFFRSSVPSTLNCFSEITFAGTGVNQRATAAGFYLDQPAAGSVTYAVYLTISAGTIDTATTSDPGDPGVAIIFAQDAGPAF